MNEIDIAGRKLALNLASLMAKVEYEYNRHEPCLVCKQKYMHHIDGRKEIVKHNRWKKNNSNT